MLVKIVTDLEKLNESKTVKKMIQSQVYDTAFQIFKITIAAHRITQ